MAKKAIRSFILDGADGRKYPVHPDMVFADAHPIVTANSALFADITEITASALTAPANVTAANVADVTADVTWDAVPGAVSYTVTTDPATDTYVVTDTEVALEGLTASTAYDVDVVANAGSPFRSDSTAGTDSFTTTA